MIERWEYKSILWVYSALSQEEGVLLPLGQHHSVSEFQIYEAGKEPDRRLASSTQRKHTTVDKTTLQDLLAEVGDEGWELVSESVLDTVIADESEGWSEVGMPVKVRWMMKRRAE